MQLDFTVRGPMSDGPSEVRLKLGDPPQAALFFGHSASFDDICPPRARPNLTAAAAHGAIKACFLVLTTCTRVQTVLLHPYTRTDCTTPSVQLYRWDDPFRTRVQPRRVEAHSRTFRITRDVQM